MKQIGIVLYLIFQFSLFGDPRDFVALVQCTPSEEVISFMQSNLDSHNARKSESLREDTAHFIEGWYGSGFLVKKDDDAFLVTNKHVAGDAELMHITFEFSSGEMLELNGDYPVYLDHFLDLALIDIPDEEFINFPGIDILTDKSLIEEGEDVFAAGYPGLLGEPSWQLTKGAVSNKQASVNFIVSTEYSRLIQHTAAIDPGNSGGPLMRKRGNQWDVIGINTYSISNRNNTFFAIPGDKIESLVGTVVRLKNSETQLAEQKAILARNSEEILGVLSDEEWDNSREHWDISWDLTIKEGWDSFNSLMSRDEEEIASISSRFGSQSLFEVYRESTFWKIWDNYQSNLEGATITFVESEEITTQLNEGDFISSTFQAMGQSFDIKFIFFRGDWLIYEMGYPFDAHSLNEPQGIVSTPVPDRESGLSRNRDWVVDNIGVNVAIYSDSQKDNSTFSGSMFGALIDISYTRQLKKFLGLYMDLGYGAFSTSYENSGSNQGYFSTAVVYTNIGTKLLLPLEIRNRYLFAPYVKGTIGVNKGAADSSGLGDISYFDLNTMWGGGFQVLQSNDLGWGISVMKKEPLLYSSNTGDDLKFEGWQVSFEFNWNIN